MCARLELCAVATPLIAKLLAEFRSIVFYMLIIIHGSECGSGLHTALFKTNFNTLEFFCGRSTAALIVSALPCNMTLKFDVFI